MSRLNVYVPDELAATIKRERPELNVSAVLQRGLQASLECRHALTVCADCAVPVDIREAVDAALGKFFVELFWALRELVDRGGTAEGAARIAKEIGVRFHITAATNAVLPRPSRAQRRANKIVEFDEHDRRATA